ncbi:MAG: hypothetical protein KF715_08395 [Candidatus Didemnitutus sp.]|nr:hypothetical protein [Candidatus Didemnitutus sp.]
MPQMPPPATPPSYYRHNHDLGRWQLMRGDAEPGYAWFEPIDDQEPPSAIRVLTPEARQRRYPMASMFAYFD